jgi:hypothetical protein
VLLIDEIDKADNRLKFRAFNQLVGVSLQHRKVRHNQIIEVLGTAGVAGASSKQRASACGD